MFFHPDCISDRRTRFYIPCRRILYSSKVTGAELLIGNKMIQPVIHYLPESINIEPGADMLLDFGYAFHGGFRILFCTESSRLDVCFGESVAESLGEPDPDSSRRHTVLDLPNYGMLEYGNTVFRFLRIRNVGNKTVHCQNIIGVALECDLELTGCFESSDKRLDEIWKTGIRTVHLCMQDYIYDGSKRDRIVWMGDLHPEIKGILCGFSDYSIIRDSFELLINQAPADQPMNGFYTYSCWFIIALWDYCCSANDRQFLLKHIDYVEKMLVHFSKFVSENGAEKIPEIRFLDWPNEAYPEAKHAGIHALLVWMMRAGSKLLRAAGRNADMCEKTLKQLCRYIPDPVGRKAPAALLTLTGLSDQTMVLETDPFSDVSTFYGYYMLMAKKTIPALQLTRKYWGAMLDFGATSFWEDFDLNWIKNAGRIDELPVPGKKDLHADFGNYCYCGLRHSLSHGWSCGPAPFLSERVLGVRFPEPGKVIVSPDLGDLEWVRGQVPAPGGVITVEADKKGVHVDLPPELIRIS